MIQGKKILAIIPARAGSKRLPGKNIKPLLGKPLIAWTIESAQQSTYLDKIVVSSDSEAVLQVAHDMACVTLRRPAELADDKAPSLVVVAHVLEHFTGYDSVVLLQPTSPLRTGADIDRCLEQAVSSATPSCVSVCESTRSTDNFVLDEQGKLLAAANTHNNRTAKRYQLNGAIYLCRIDWLLAQRAFVTDESSAYIMPVSRSVDIDEQQDFDQVQALLEEINE